MTWLGRGCWMALGAALVTWLVPVLVLLVLILAWLAWSLETERRHQERMRS